MALTGANRRAQRAKPSAAMAVRQMFDSIAPALRSAEPRALRQCGPALVAAGGAALSSDLADPDAAILDICCGTGDMTMALLKHRPAGARPIHRSGFFSRYVEPADEEICRVQLQRSQQQYPSKPMHFICLCAQPRWISSSSAFGFRNLANYEAGLREFNRVLKPGGQLGILDFSEPGGLIGKAYAVYFRRILPAIGRVICGKDGAV